MAKQIDEQELVNTKHISNSFGEFTVLECIGKIKTQYCYKIQFTTTGNIETTTRKSILDKTCVDKKEKEKIVKANKAKRTQEEFARRKKMNQFKGKASFQCTNPNDLMVLALDQSTKHTGYSIPKNRKRECANEAQTLVVWAFSNFDRNLRTIISNKSIINL